MDVLQDIVILFRVMDMNRMRDGYDVSTLFKGSRQKENDQKSPDHCCCWQDNHLVRELKHLPNVSTLCGQWELM